MYYGVQYYPEHWPEARWSVDAEMMARAGVNTVRMGEFAWSAWEPEEGRLDFGWMDRALELLARRGIRTIMCTCSRTPPPWVFKRYPGAGTVGSDGLPVDTGHRYTVGLAHPEFVELSDRIDRAVIGHYAGHPAIVGWQIDNEVGSGNDCWCPRCHRLFQERLAGEHGTIGALNEAWGSHFWSSTFSAFDEIPLPRRTTGSSPQLALAWRRFLSGLNVDFARRRAAMIRELDPGKWVTTNFQSFRARHTDYFQMAGALDINGMNHYPARSPEFILDYYRGTRGKVLSLEQCTRLAPVDIGEGWMRLWAWRAIAHGACGISFFRWRCCRWGQEQHADGILPHSGRENRRYRELARMGAEIARVGDLIDRTAPDNGAAIVVSYESRWALEAGLGLKELDGAAEATRIHERLLERNIGVDATDPRDPLARYRLVFAPRLFLVDAAIAANLRGYVEAGGLLVLTAGSGVVDEHNKSFDAPRPGPLAEIAGIEVSDMAPLEGPVAVESADVPGLHGQAAALLADEIQPTTAAVIARFAAGWRRGLPAVTQNTFGKGRVLTFGAGFEGAAMAALVDYACGLAGLDPILETPPGVRAHLRRGGGTRLLFLLNTGEVEQHVAVAGGWRDCIGGEPVHIARVAPVDMRLLRGQEERT